MTRIHSTTILCVRRDGHVALGGDGQVTLGDTVMKANANKVRALKGGKILAGFAGASADAFTLFEKFEEKLERYPGNLPRAAVEPAKGWRENVASSTAAARGPSAARGGRQGARLRHLGLGRADRAGRRHPGDRVLGQLRPRCRAGAGELVRACRQGRRAARPRDRGGDLRVHEHAHQHSGAVMADPTRTPEDAAPPPPPPPPPPPAAPPATPPAQEELPWLE